MSQNGPRASGTFLDELDEFTRADRPHTMELSSTERQVVLTMRGVESAVSEFRIVMDTIGSTVDQARADRMLDEDLCRILADLIDFAKVKPAPREPPEPDDRRPVPRPAPRVARPPAFVGGADRRRWR